MNKAWNKVKKLHESGARHIKKGKKISDFTLTQILSHAAEEVVELAFEPDDIEEFADILGCLFHYAVKQGWSKSDVEKAIINKLNERVK